MNRILSIIKYNFKYDKSMMIKYILCSSLFVVLTFIIYISSILIPNLLMNKLYEDNAERIIRINEPTQNDYDFLFHSEYIKDLEVNVYTYDKSEFIVNDIKQSDYLDLKLSYNYNNSILKDNEIVISYDLKQKYNININDIFILNNNKYKVVSYADDNLVNYNNIDNILNREIQIAISFKMKDIFNLTDLNEEAKKHGVIIEVPKILIDGVSNIITIKNFLLCSLLVSLIISCFIVFKLINSFFDIKSKYLKMLMCNGYSNKVINKYKCIISYIYLLITYIISCLVGKIFVLYIELDIISKFNFNSITYSYIQWMITFFAIINILFIVCVVIIKYSNRKKRYDL